MTSYNATAPKRRFQPQLEELESRLNPSGLHPTELEQVLLERLNDARANPAAYGSSIGLNLSNISSSQPLAFDPRLIGTARGHSQDMNANNFFSHNGSDGRNAGKRLTDAGYSYQHYGESIAAGFGSPEAALRGLIIDQGVPDLGHRRHLLAIDAAFRNHKQVGVGIVMNGSGAYSNYFTIDSGHTSDSRAFLTGVVFNDKNNNGKYDVGESGGQVNVTIHGVASFTTYATGGFSYALNPGTYNVTFSGGSVRGLVTKTFSIGTGNKRLYVLTNNESSPGTTSDRIWVQQVYQRLLGRAIPDSLLDRWENDIRTGGTTRESIVNSLVSSGDYQRLKRIRWVARTGYDILGRSLKQEETFHWVDYLQNGGYEETVAWELIKQRGWPNLSHSDFINRMMIALVGRGATAAEFSAWGRYMAAGTSHFTILRGVINSQQYQYRVHYRHVNQIGWNLLGGQIAAADLHRWSVHLVYGGSDKVFVNQLAFIAKYD